MVVRAACLGMLLVAAPATSLATSLEEAIRSTLSTNPDILASEYSVDAADEVRKQARGGYFPSLDLVIAGGREESNNTTTLAAGTPDLRLTRKERSLRLTQRIYDGGATINAVRQQTALADAAVARLADTRQSVSLRAIQVYLEVLRRDEIVSLAEDNLEQHEDTLNKITERFESGVGTRVDVVQTQGRRSQAKSNLLLAQRDAKNGRAEYYRVVGLSVDSLSKPAAAGGVPQTLEAALALASDNNPGLAAAAARLEAAAAARKQAGGAFHPRVDLELGATRNDDLDGVIGANDDESAVVRVSYNLFRGGADQARRNEAEAREFAAREVLRSNELAVEEDVTLIWNELQDILVRLEYLEAHVRATEEVVAVYEDQLTLGKRTLLDLLDVKNELLRANIAYVSGQYALMLARYRLLAGTGQLLDAMAIDPEG